MAGVTPNGIHYPDGASKAKNLGPELERMANDIDTYIGSYLRPDGPIRSIIITIVEDVVPDVLDGENIMRAYPDETIPLSTGTRVPIQWVAKTLDAPITEVITETIEGKWVGTRRRRGFVPLLTEDGWVRPAQIPPSIARVADIPDVPDVTVPDVHRVISAQFPIFAARVGIALRRGEAVAMVLAGSSTTSADPGYTGRLAEIVQQAYTGVTPSVPQWSRTAQFTERTGPGLHIYNAGDGGTTASDYLTDAECARIAALSPAAMVHMIGANDYYFSVEPSTYQSTLAARLAYLDSQMTAPCQHILVHTYPRWGMGSPSPNPYEYPWNDYLLALEAVAASRGDTVVVDTGASFAALGVAEGNHPDPLSLVSSDGVHPSADGYRVIGDVLGGTLLD